MTASKGKAKKVPTLSKKKATKKDNLTLLEDALVKSAEKSTRAKKRAQQEKKEALEKQLQDKQAKQVSQEVVDPLLQNTEDMLNVEAGRSINKAIMEDGAASGLDAALASLNVGVAPTEAKSQKALYKEFEERMMPQVKEDYPGLRLSQYQEKIFGMWKKSPENPMNQILPS